MGEESFNLSQPIGEWVSNQKAENRDRPMTEYHFDDLAPMSQYQAEIRAYNGMGWSAPGPIFVFRTGDGKDDRGSKI